MSTIVTRAGKGSPLTNTEVDTNFTNLNTDKIQSGDTVASLDINGGTIDGTTIGGSTPAVGSFTQVNADNLRLDGNALTSTNTNGNIDLTPNGTGEVNITKVDIDSGTIDNTAIGGATPAAGAFTTLSASSTVTLSGGTANGVLYLDGSKVATSGSALVFDGTNLGIGNTSPASYNGSADNLVIGSSGSNGMTIVSGTSNAGYIMFADGTTGQQAYEGQITYDHSVNQMFFNVNAAEQMRLTSTGLGIGTSSPAVKLDVTGSGRFYSSGEALTVGADALAANTAQYFRNTSGYGVLALTSASDQYLVGAVAGDFVIASNAKSLRFGNAGTGALQATLDSSGNLGLGVTPSAWAANFRALDINGGQGGGAVFSASNVPFAGVMTNAYFSSGGPVYKQDGFAGYYLQNMQTSSGGTHAWFTAPSGTAGNAISFSQVMTLDASGNLLLNTTGSPAASAKMKIATSSRTGAFFDLTATGGENWIIDSTNTSGSTDVLGIYASGATGMYLTDSGNLLVGTTSSLSGTSHSFQATGTTVSHYAGIFCHNGTSGNGRVFGWQLPNTNNISSYFVYATNSGGNCLNIFGNGDITNSNNSYGAISDVKLKENVVDATPKLEKLNQVRIVNFNIIGSDQKQLGVIAQEIEQIFPDMVSESPDRDAEGNDLGTKTKSVKYSVFVPMLIKAMQEQQEIIESLKSRLDAAGL